MSSESVTYVTAPNLHGAIDLAARRRLVAHATPNIFLLPPELAARRHSVTYLGNEEKISCCQLILLLVLLHLLM